MATEKKAPNPRNTPPRKLEGLGRGTAESVRRATEVLEGELAAGVTAARKAGERFKRERKLDAADLEEVLARFRADGHELVEVARELTAELRSDATDALAQKLIVDAHGALDTVLDLVTLAPDLVNRLLQLAGTMSSPAQARGGTTQQGGSEGSRSRAAKKRTPR